MTHRVVSTVLRHDAKQTSYEIALLRALNDAALAYPDLRFDGRDVSLWVEALLEVEGVGWDEVRGVQEALRAARGGFEQRLVLRWTEKG